MVNNQLSGTLPESWSSLSSMRVLSLGTNNFVGFLPSSWSSIAGIEYLYVSYSSIAKGCIDNVIAEVSTTTS